MLEGGSPAAAVRTDRHPLEDACVDIDVALVPEQARSWEPTVCVVVDELRASSTITVLLDLGCGELCLTAGLEEARRLAAARGSLLVGERNGRTPRGFDLNNSPAELSRTRVDGRDVVLCTTNGTVVIGRVQHMPAVLVGSLLNARACAEAALELAQDAGTGVRIVCAGQRGRFALDDAVTAGVVVERMVETCRARGIEHALSDAARASIDLRSAYPDLLGPLRESTSGRLLISVGAEADIERCARVDSSRCVPILRRGRQLRIEALERP